MIEKVSKLSQPIGHLKQSLLWLMMVLLKFKTVTNFFQQRIISTQQSLHKDMLCYILLSER